jgi:methylmalonyl-CoA mutase, N-terminal domain
LPIETPDYWALEAEQRSRLAEVKRSRDGGAASSALEDVRQAAGSAMSLMPPIIDAVRARATLGEISDTLRGVWGVYRAR